MSKLFFHNRLKKIIPLIKTGSLDAAEKEIVEHIENTSEDMSEDEYNFAELVKAGHAYMSAMQEAQQIIRKSKIDQSDASEAIEPIKKAIESGKEIVKFADEVKKLTNKEEMDAL